MFRPRVRNRKVYWKVKRQGKESPSTRKELSIGLSLVHGVGFNRKTGSCVTCQVTIMFQRMQGSYRVVLAGLGLLGYLAICLSIALCLRSGEPKL